jgi:4-amino-4-deoxy-L-arabinose transferase-like glycosyltransferase
MNKGMMMILAFKTKTIIFTILIVLGLLLRCYYTDWDKKLTGDEVGYNKMVLQLLHEGVYGYTPYVYSEKPNAFTTPGYPLFLAGCYVVFGYAGDHPPVVQIQALQILIQLICAVIMYMIARRMFAHTGISLFIMACYLFHPTFILSPLYLLTETLYGLFFLLFIYLLVRCTKVTKLRWFLLLGVVFGICILIRPTIVPFIVILLAGVAVYGRKHGMAAVLKAISTIIIGFVVVMLPWWIRNWITLDKVLLLAEQTGNPLLWGSYPFERRPNVDVSQDPAEMGRIAYERIINGFRNEFFTYLSWYSWGKIMIYISEIFPGLGYMTANKLLSKMITIMHLIVMVIGLGGLVKIIIHERRNASYMMIALLAVFSILLYLPFSPTPRYFYPTIPLCFLGLGYLLSCIAKFKGRPNKNEGFRA